MFRVYFDTGREHILNYQDGYDHLLFIIALCAVYLMRDWKKVLILVTAFTIGHSITLFLSSKGIIPVNRALVEFLVPLTIFITAFSNLFKNEEAVANERVQINYVYALFFGLIHGLAFSNDFKSMMGKTPDIVSQLLAFNLGIEVGQIIVVVIFLTISFIFVDLLTMNRRDWKLIISSAVAGIALMMIKERWYWD